MLCYCSLCHIYIPFLIFLHAKSLCFSFVVTRFFFLKKNFLYFYWNLSAVFPVFSMYCIAIYCICYIHTYTSNPHLHNLMCIILNYFSCPNSFDDVVICFTFFNCFIMLVVAFDSAFFFFYLRCPCFYVFEPDDGS